MAGTLFKKTTTHYWLFDAWVDPEGRPCPVGAPAARFVKRRWVPKGTPGAKKRKEKSSKWYGRLPGSTKAVPLSANKVVALQMLAGLTSKNELAKVGLDDPFKEQRERPLAEHLADYRRELVARDNDPRYVELVVSRLTGLFDGCGFRTLPDVSASRVLDWLAQQRRGEPARELPPDLTLFSRAQAAEVLGMTPSSFRDAVKRLSLPATGKGTARRYPRPTVEAVRDRAGRGRSVQTTNYYLSHLKSFCRWLVRDQRVAESPVAHLEANNVAVDRRHDRRELAADELPALLRATRRSRRVARGMAGEDRYHLYATACGTGLRAGALASLTPAHFDLSAQTPTVALAA